MCKRIEFESNEKFPKTVVTGRCRILMGVAGAPRHCANHHRACSLTFAGVVLTLRSPSGLLVANLSPRISLERRDKLNGKVDDDMMRSCFVRPFFFARNCEGTFHSLPCQSGLPLYRYIYFDKNSRWKTKPLVTLHMVCISKLRSFC